MALEQGFPHLEEAEGDKRVEEKQAGAGEGVEVISPGFGVTVFVPGFHDFHPVGRFGFGGGVEAEQGEKINNQDGLVGEDKSVIAGGDFNFHEAEFLETLGHEGLGGWQEFLEG